MNKFVLVFTALFLVFVAGVQSQQLPPRTDPPRLVNDLAGMLTEPQRSALEDTLTAFDNTTSNQIAVVTVHSLGGADISAYALKLFIQWGIGTKKNNNGLLLFIARDDRKAWITVGRGLEAVVTDAMARRVIDLDLTPAFKAGNYYEGIRNATHSLMRLSKGEFHETRKRDAVKSFKPSFLLIFIIIVAIVILFNRGGGGGGGSDHISRRGSNWPFWFLLGNALGSGSRDSWGGGTSGGGWGGGDSGGGGGFGGFGGGDSGGGGAGGSW